MKFAEPRPYADPDATVRKLLERANAVAAEPLQDGLALVELTCAANDSATYPHGGYC